MPPAARASQPSAVEIDPLTKARRHAEYERLRTGSFPNLCRQLLTGVCLPCGEQRLTQGLQKEIADHSADAADLHTLLHKSLEELGNAVADAEESDDFTAAVAAIDSLNLDRPLVIQKTVRLWATAVELAEKRLAELRPQLQPLVDAHAQLFGEVKAELTAMGSGVESMFAYGKGPAAERQFDFFARQNLRVRQAFAAAEDARAQIDGAQQALYARSRGLEAAKNALRAEAFRHAAA
jgi:hypothetical protein